MTNRDFLNAVINNEINENVIAYATDRLRKLDERNEVRKSKAREIKPEDQQLIDEIIAVLENSETPLVAADIRTAVATDCTSSKVSSIIKKIENVEAVPVKVNGRFKNAYKIVK